MRDSRAARIVGLVIFLLACNSGNLLRGREQPQPTPTFILAKYVTPTDTPQPEPTPAVELTGLASPEPTNPVSRTPSAAESEADALTPTPQAPTASPMFIATGTPTVGPLSPANAEPTPHAAVPTAAVRPTLAALSGRIAFPVDDGGGYYDVWLVDLPNGSPYLVQARARQPDFSDDGRLLVKMQGSDLGESIGLLDANFTWLGILNESPEDSYPFWDPGGTRYTYSNSNLVKDPNTAHLAPYVFTSCSLQIPRFENAERCRDTRQWGHIEVGDAPVWTADDRIVFFSYKGDDGLYFVESASVLREAGGLGPKQLLVRSNGRPTDTAGFRVFFSAGDIDGNWEAYAIDLDGTNLTNLSQSPLSQDGLPAVSPDGSWVAFVSDRDGRWGIWVKPLAGGAPSKAVDFSEINTNPSPWGMGNRAWTTERISWGPSR